ncbi:MAG: hypothetical protein R6X32_10760 [Chloroflexota bacterium]
MAQAIVINNVSKRYGRGTKSVTAVELYRLTPTFTVRNISSWLHNGLPFTLPGIDYTPADLTFSLLVLAGWLLGLLLIAILIFQRQDITS